MKRTGWAILVVAIMLGTSLFAGASAGEQYERNHLEYLRQQNKLLERQNELLRDQVAQVKRIADLMEKGQR
jgi:hypothetical protein